MQKTMTAEEIRDSGLLQEMNRLFLHPLGLAAAVNMETGSREHIDERADPEGWVFAEGVMEEQKRLRFEAWREEKHVARRKLLGFIIQRGAGEPEIPRQEPDWRR